MRQISSGIVNANVTMKRKRDKYPRYATVPCSKNVLQHPVLREALLKCNINE